MTSEKNKISFDFANNPDLKALFGGWNVGESYELTIKFQLDSMDENGAQATVQEVVSEEPDAQGEQTEIEPDANKSPVMIVMGAGGAKEPYVAP
jgi:hypothetical protein